MSGFEQDFLSVIKKVKIRTQLNTTTDSEIGTDEETVDLMFLASKEQEYGTTENGIYNDEPWEYYKQTTGLASPGNSDNTGRIKYGLEAQSTANWHRLRSPTRWYSYYAWSCLTAGSLSYGSANNSSRCAPACVIA